jgi:hypothetical protein
VSSRCSMVANAFLKQEPVVMGPRFRGDDE